MKRILSCSLLVVTLACSRSETTEVATTSDTVSPGNTTTYATETITPETPAAAPAATGTIAADTVAPSTTPGVASPAAPRSQASAPKTQAPAPEPQTELPPPQVSAVTEPVPTPKEPVPTPKVEQTPPAEAAPVPTTPVANGQALFKAKCANCHGADGKKPQGGRTLASAAVQSQSEAELARIIREGKGKVSAAAHKRAALNNEQIGAVVAYIKALQ